MCKYEQQKVELLELLRAAVRAKSEFWNKLRAIENHELIGDTDVVDDFVDNLAASGGVDMEDVDALIKKVDEEQRHRH